MSEYSANGGHFGNSTFGNPSLSFGINGGGGGANGTGGDATDSLGAGLGGSGLSVNIRTGSGVVYGAGGNAGANGAIDQVGSNGSLGTNVIGTKPGDVNSGDGGSAAYAGSTIAGSGGSGIVIIRYTV